MEEISQKLIEIVSVILKVAVYLSMGSIIVGIVLLFIKNGADGYSLSTLANYSNYSVAKSYSSIIFSPTKIPEGIITLDPLGFISLGLWVLIFTPVSVLFTSLVDYIYQKNKLYVVLTFLVLFNLFTAIFIIPSFVHL
ncbi:MAG: DUF1634 domain-containing protein [Cuniculiplasma sp.]|nr:DUF1634 domain-containing protein [Cuniculiplasma sp.]